MANKYFILMKSALHLACVVKSLLSTNIMTFPSPNVTGNELSLIYYIAEKDQNRTVEFQMVKSDFCLLTLSHIGKIKDMTSDFLNDVPHARDVCTYQIYNKEAQMAEMNSFLRNVQQSSIISPRSRDDFHVHNIKKCRIHVSRRRSLLPFRVG